MQTLTAFCQHQPAPAVQIPPWFDANAPQRIPHLPPHIRSNSTVVRCKLTKACKELPPKMKVQIPPWFDANVLKDNSSISNTLFKFHRGSMQTPDTCPDFQGFLRLNASKISVDRQCPSNRGGSTEQSNGSALHLITSTLFSPWIDGTKQRLCPL